MMADANPKIKIYKMTNDKNEALDIIKNEQSNIDIIFLDLKNPHYIGLEILDYIETNNLTKYRDSIIIIAKEIEALFQIENNQYVYSYLDKITEFEEILAEINKLVEEKENTSIEIKVINELKKLNYNFTYIGTKYLIESIILLYNKENFEDAKLDKEIYLKLSKKHNKTVNNIKTNIIHATDSMRYDCELDKLNKYFGFFVDEKPTPKIVIFTVINNLKHNF